MRLYFAGSQACDQCFSGTYSTGLGISLTLFLIYENDSIRSAVFNRMSVWGSGCEGCWVDAPLFK